jgi:hypothetical protein
MDIIQGAAVLEYQLLHPTRALQIICISLCFLQKHGIQQITFGNDVVLYLFYVFLVLG